MAAAGSNSSWIAYAENHPFPIQNLPYGAFRTSGDPTPRPCVRIADQIVDLRELERAGLLAGCASAALFEAPVLNAFLAQGTGAWSAVRTRLQDLLGDKSSKLAQDPALRQLAIIPIERVEMTLPVEIGDYTDFYSSKQHAFNVGTMFRGPENALMPNYLWMPIGYHGRASSIVLSGTDVRRPCGQINPNDAAAPEFSPSRTLDFELETGFLIGPGNQLGQPIPMNRAEEHIFGMVIVNDWSARDIQRWEYQPLGPFLAKNFATSISPWIVPMAALAPFRVTPAEQSPPPLPYLQRTAAGEGNPAAGWSYDIQLEVALATQKQTTPHVISRSNCRHLYWTMSQQLAHHTITGCNLRPGDLLASGTISGPTEDSYGSMLELAWRGTKPIKLPSGEERRFIQDGDTVIMRAWCEGQGYRIGFGECTGRVLPANISS